MYQMSFTNLLSSRNYYNSHHNINNFLCKICKCCVQCHINDDSHLIQQDILQGEENPVIDLYYGKTR